MTAAKTLWRFVSWMPGALFRRIFSQRWLAERTTIDIRPRHEPVSIRGGDQQEIVVWLNIANRGHFDVELDRLWLELVYGAARMQAVHLSRILLKAGTTAEVMVRGGISPTHITHIAQRTERPWIELRVNAEFNCKVHNFAVDTGPLQGFKPDLMNI